MRTLVLYLNELSCACSGISREEIANHLDEMIVAANKVLSHRKDTIIRMHCKLGDLTLGDEHLSLGALLPGVNARFAQLKRMVDRAPCGPLTNCLQEVLCNGQIATGLAWADLDGSFTLSFGHGQWWSANSIPCERHTMDDSTGISAEPVSVPNVAIVAQVEFWKQTIQNYGKEAASSSLLYRGNGFVMRMHFHDHPPCHVHIYPRQSDTNDLIAKLRVDNGDIMEGRLSSAMNAEIGQVIKDYRQDLLESWDNIQAGELPVKIQ